ncbi:hypothetical protein GCM10020219_038510 [Nonomuraea dietziae]
MLPSRLRRRIDALGAGHRVGRGPRSHRRRRDPHRHRRRHPRSRAAALRLRGARRYGERAHGGAHRLVYTGRRWYLLAWDTGRADWRTFRADRIAPATPNGPRFTPRRPPSDAATHVVRGVASTAWRYAARVRLHAPLRSCRSSCRPPPALLHDDGVLETGGESLHNLAAFLGTLGVPFTVLDPPELRDLLHSLATRTPTPDARPVAGTRRDPRRSGILAKKARLPWGAG